MSRLRKSVPVGWNDVLVGISLGSGSGGLLKWIGNAGIVMQEGASD